MLIEYHDDKDVKIQGIEDAVFKVVAQSEHETESGKKVRVNTAVHDQVFARRIGGVRFVEGDLKDLEELGKLAAAMTWKSPISWIPADGEKTVVYAGNQELTADEKACVLKEHLEKLKEKDPGVIFGPDMNCGEDVMDLLTHYGEEDHVSGLSEENGGFSIDKNGFTAYGMDVALKALEDQLDWKLKGKTASIQGLGAVGAHIAKKLFDRGVIIRAVSNKGGEWIATTERGLDASQLLENWRQGGDKAFSSLEAIPPYDARYTEGGDIWKEKVDIFVPAARTNVLALLEDEKDAVDVRRFMEDTGVKLILEGANGPLTKGAESFLEAEGVIVLPDFLINCGGLIGCWVDWIYRRELREREKQEDYSKKALLYVEKAIRDNIADVLMERRVERAGVREIAENLARRRRKVLVTRFQEFKRSATEPDSDGRGFARSLMNDLLAGKKLHT